MLHADGFKGLLLFLIAAGVVMPILHRFRVGSVLGFILVGALLGPYVAGRLGDSLPWIRFITFDDPVRVEPLAELGIIFLLFLLGLELSLDRLWQMRSYVFGIGSLQMVITALSLAFIIRMVGGPPPSGIVLGLCFALSSTAIVMQILSSQHRTLSKVGRIALSVLLFQDLMVVPILFVVGALAHEGQSALLSLFRVFAIAIAAVAFIMAMGRYLARPLLRRAAETGNRDLLMAITLVIVVGASSLTGAVGLSVGLGAFLAGLLLSESEYRHQIEVDIEPFKGLLLGIFFVSVGMTIDPEVVIAHVVLIVCAVIALLAVKASILLVAARLFRVPWSTSAELALLLAQAGEFAFVVIGIARGKQLLPPEWATSAIAVAGLSMLATPLLALLARRVAARLEKVDHAAHTLSGEAAELQDHVIIGGFGRVGQLIAAALESEQIPYIAFDLLPAQVAEQRERGRHVYFADAGRREILERAGARRASAFVVTLDAPTAAEHMVHAIKRINPQALILARAKDARHARRLAELGAKDVIPEATEASLQLATRLMQMLEMPDEVVGERIDEIRRAEMQRMRVPVS